MTYRAMPNAEFAKLPYVKSVPSDGRIILLAPYYDAASKDWILHMPVGDRELGRLAGGEPVLSSYFSTAPARPDRDYPFLLGTVVAQHLSFPGVVGAMQSIESDIFRFCAVLEKYRLISSATEREGLHEELFASELEYLVMLIRSLYDLLQQLAKNAAALVRTLDANRRRVMADLPDSFAKVVLDGTRPRTSDELADRFGLPEPLARFYVTETARFAVVRDLRVAIEHHGATVPQIYSLSEGAAVRTAEEPWSRLSIWRPTELKPNGLGSLRLLFASLIRDALDMTGRYAQAYLACVAVPPALSDGVRVYLRHPYSVHLVTLNDVVQQPWERQHAASRAMS